MQFVDLHAQYLTIREEIDAAIAAVIKDSAFVRSSEVDAFEEEFARKMEVGHCVSCGNGTDALGIAMKALGLKSGDEVITTAHSWIATSEMISQAGGRVVFCDTDEYHHIDVNQIESRITPKTRGIIPVHLYGQPADMDPILEIARRHGLWVIEDCAQAHLATYKGRKVGTMGDVGTFSFYPGKNLGAMGDAGALITQRSEIAEFSALYARHGGKGNHVMEGVNSRLDGIQAAILRVKLHHLDRWTRMRQDRAVFYDAHLRDIAGIRIPIVRPECQHVFHLYVIQCSHRDELRVRLRENQIPTVINYPKPLPFYEAYRYLDHCESDFPVAESHATQILSIPIFPELEERDQRRICEIIADFADNIEH